MWFMPGITFILIGECGVNCLAFILPCSSAKRTVNACVLPSGITLFSAEMASCASSRLLNLKCEKKNGCGFGNVFGFGYGMWGSVLGEGGTYLTKATPRGLPVNLSRRIFFCTIKPYLPNMVSNWSSVMVRGRFVTYKLVSLISSPDGLAYETCKSNERMIKILVWFVTRRTFVFIIYL